MTHTAQPRQTGFTKNAQSFSLLRTRNTRGIRYSYATINLTELPQVAESRINLRHQQSVALSNQRPIRSKVMATKRVADTIAEYYNLFQENVPRIDIQRVCSKLRNSPLRE